MFADPFKAVRRERLGDMIARQLELAIRSGQYPAGVRLPAQRQLAQELGVSRPVLRESLQILELRGLIVTHPGSGTYVVEPLDVSASPTTWLSENFGRVAKFYEFRRVIEPPAAELAARRASPAGIAGLKRNIEEAANTVNRNDVIAFVTLDIEFHSIIAQLSENPFLLFTLNQIIHLETDVRQVIHRLPGHLAVAHRRHEAIYDAIASGNAALARARMNDALTHVMDDLLEAGVA